MSMQACCPPKGLSNEDFCEPAELFKAIADPHRLAILASLARAQDDELCVCDFTAGLPLNQPAVSHHLKILRDASLVTCERRGTWVYYRLAPDALRKLHDALTLVFPAKVLR
jgi:ArsR family transcriptional regulator